MSINEYNEVHPRDYDRIDSLAQSNMLFKDKKLMIFKNKVDACSNFFQYMGKAKVEAIAELALEKNFETAAFVSALDKILTDYDKFPSFQVLTILVRSFSKQKHENNEGLEIWKYQKDETREYLEIKDSFIKEFGEKKLGDFTRWWLEGTYPALKVDMLNSMCLTKESFERCALFDWYDNGKGKDFNKVIGLSKSKLDKLIERNDKSPHAYKRIE